MTSAPSAHNTASDSCWDGHPSPVGSSSGLSFLKPRGFWLLALHCLSVLPASLPQPDGVFPRAQLEQSKALELQGVMAAEAGDLSTALERFGQAISLLPERASAYNNRAQARRLQGDVAGERRWPGASAGVPAVHRPEQKSLWGWEIPKLFWNLYSYL